jgi:hypothetical protein
VAGCATNPNVDEVLSSSDSLTTGCDPSLPFLAPVKLDELGKETGPATLSFDETTMYLVLGGKLHVAKRAARGQPFSAPAPAPGFEHRVVGGLALTPTSSHLFYSVASNGVYRVFVAPHVGTHPCGGEYCDARPAGLPHLPILAVDGGIALGGDGLYVPRGGPMVGGTVVRYDLTTGAETPASRFESHASYGSPAVHGDESRLYMFRSLDARGAHDDLPREAHVRSVERASSPDRRRARRSGEDRCAALGFARRVPPLLRAELSGRRREPGILRRRARGHRGHALSGTRRPTT